MPSVSERRVSLSTEDTGELVAGADPQLAEHLMEVVLDRARADVEAGADLGVRETVPGQPGYLSLLECQLVAGLGPTLARGFACGRQLPLCARREGLDAHVGKHVLSGSQLLARIEPATLAAQPLPVQQAGARKLHAHARPRQPLNRLEVEALGLIAVAQQRKRAGLDA